MAIRAFFDRIRPHCEIIVRMERRVNRASQVNAYVTIILLASCPCASALNPSYDINQYAHTAWTIREGFFKGAISSIAQTPDGYLWLGTEFGLPRFDGVRSVPCGSRGQVSVSSASNKTVRRSDRAASSRQHANEPRLG